MATPHPTKPDMVGSVDIAILEGLLLCGNFKAMSKENGWGKGNAVTHSGWRGPTRMV